MDTKRSWNRSFSRHASTLLAIFAILALAFPAARSASAQEVVNPYDIYVVNVKTGIAERLTTLEGTGEYNPSWSPDGDKIVHDVVGADFHTLYITDVRTHLSTPLPGADGGNDAAWSPNENWIVFDRRWVGDSNLYLLPPSGGTPRLVVSNAVNADWSPEEDRLVFERDGGLWTSGIWGGTAKKVVDEGLNPVWSPDGMWIAYDLNGDIWKVRVSDSGARLGYPIQLTSNPAWESGPTWSAGGGKIAFGSDASGDWDIWQINANGSGLTRLVRTNDDGDYDPAFAKNDSTLLAYDGARMPAQPYIVAFPQWGYIEGQDWPKGDTVHLAIDDPRTKVRPDYQADQPTVPNDWGTWWVQFNFEYDLKIGDKVTESTMYLTRTYIVQKLAVSAVSLADNTVAGIAVPGAKVYLWVYTPDGTFMEARTNDRGKWMADFDSIGFTLAAGMCGRVEVRDAIGNRTAVEWCV